MKKVLMSIHPKWCEKIFNGEKTIEVRKIAPKIDTPFEVLVYCTASDVHSCLLMGGGTLTFIYASNYKTAIPVGGEIVNGQVIGSFVCDRVDEYAFSNLEAQYRINDMALVKTCLNHPELIAYGKGKILSGLHITKPKLFDTPKELSEFRVVCHRTIHCRACEYVEVVWHEDEQCFYYECRRPSIIRPPQSWCYVEV